MIRGQYWYKMYQKSVRGQRVLSILINYTNIPAVL